ncbi:MAG: hypothetical protein HC924_18695 [Synechococcaceae cyanobacterium SM2_3_2]|nr:hypothetical protein [Synechococcaceae cyanobacterium SM2_3_2]
MGQIYVTGTASEAWVNTLLSNNQLSVLALESLTALAQQDWLQPLLSQGLPTPDQALRQQGWIDDTSSLPDLNQELGL